MLGDGIKEIVYYGTLKTSGKIMSSCKSIYHTGDNRTGNSCDMDSESIEVFINKIPDKFNKIIFFVDIYRGKTRGQTFSTSKIMFTRIYNKGNGEILATQDLSMDSPDATSYIVGKMVRTDDSWKYEDINQPGTETLSEFTKRY